MIDDQIKQIQYLGYSVDYNIKGNYITCILLNNEKTRCKSFQYKLPLNIEKVLIELSNYKRFTEIENEIL